MLNRRGETYTMKDEKFFTLLDELRKQAGGNWKDIARASRLSTRTVRRMRNGQNQTVSWTYMDKMLSRMGFPHRIQEFEFYTPEQLVEMGIWKPHNISGLCNQRNV